MVYFPENRGLLGDPRERDADLITRRVAHEVAHQRWAQALDPADLAAAPPLVEAGARRGGRVAGPAPPGGGGLPPMLAFDEDRYLAGRPQEPDSEPTLLETAGQAYL